MIPDDAANRTIARLEEQIAGLQDRLADAERRKVLLDALVGYEMVICEATALLERWWENRGETGDALDAPTLALLGRLRPIVAQIAVRAALPAEEGRMGNITDAIINGSFCALCGVAFLRPHGFSVLCRECWREHPADRIGHSKATEPEA